MQVIRQKYGKKTVFIEPALVNFGAHLHAGAKGNFNIPYKVETKNGPVTKYLKVTERTITRILGELEDAGFIRLEYICNFFRL